MLHRYTNEQRVFIQENYSGRRTEELTELFNREFGTNLKWTQLRAYKKNHKLPSGVDTRLKPSNESWRKGTSTDSEELPSSANWQPVGCERWNAHGFLEVKVGEPNVWQTKHYIIWEQHYGRSVPSGHKVIFKDQNVRNLDPHNLQLISNQDYLMKGIQGVDLNDHGLTVEKFRQNTRRQR